MLVGAPNALWPNVVWPKAGLPKAEGVVEEVEANAEVEIDVGMDFVVSGL